MAVELGQISFYLAKDGGTFDNVLADDKLPTAENENYKIRSFKVDDVEAKFVCLQSESFGDNPIWLDFINDKIEDLGDKVTFTTFSRRPSGVLLLKVDANLFAATFGVKGGSFIHKTRFHSDFGIKTAMNMCGNTELRQTKSSTHTATTKQIDRQLSRPSDSFDFGLSETEFLKYISAQIEGNKNVTLQGKDSLSIKLIGESKLNWTRLIEYCRAFLEQYEKNDYSVLFPNYLNLQEIEDDVRDELDKILVEKIKSSDFEQIHLAIPEFISDDKYSFSYTNHDKLENYIVSHLRVEDFENNNIFKKIDKLDAKKLASRYVYAYSHKEDKILEHEKWSLYSCIVAEEEMDGKYYILTEGEWKQLDNDFYKSVSDFVEEVLTVREISKKYHNIDISDNARKQNREEKFNLAYVEKNASAYRFDQAKLRIGESKGKYEFCDILELNQGNSASIIHVKKYGGSSSINYLFSQSRFYCESFLSDKTFLLQIRNHIDKSDHKKKAEFLTHIREGISAVSGHDYEVNMWLLYDNSKKKAPTKSDLPLMTKYELKLAYERLRNINKFKEVSLSMVPVKMVNYSSSKKKGA